MPTVPIDPAAGPKLALSGRVVTMDDQFQVFDDGRIYIEGGKIAAVRKRGAAVPEGFEDVDPVDTGGTVYPGLIELHNHLAYNALQLWQVPKRYTNRDQWGSGGTTPDYRRLVSGPMKLIGPDPKLMPAVVRYVECKALVGGTTTSQGIEIFSNKGARRYYRGNIRNVEETDDPDLPGAGTRIGDVDAASAAASPQDDQAQALLHPPPERRDRRRRPRPLPGPQALRRRVGARRLARRDPLRRAQAEGLRGARPLRRFDGLVAAIQPAALRPDRRPRGRQGRGGQDRHRPGLVPHRQQEPARRAQGGTPRKRSRRRPLR